MESERAAIQDGSHLSGKWRMIGIIALAELMALTLQTSLGFLLTMVSIRLIPVFESAVGWEWAFAMLAAGPLVGI